MRFTYLRQRLLTRAFAVLLSIVTGGGALNWGHVGGDDPGCAPQLVQHDHSAHRFSAERQAPESQDDHCTLCHLLRLMCTALPTKSLVASHVSQVETRRSVESAIAAASFNLHVPSRAPPTAAL
jgi:hypothetical protein